jgi:F-type H+-transporting ATPase subunit b
MTFATAAALYGGAAQAAADVEHASPNIFSGDLGNVIWTLITFLAVVFVLGKFAWKPILGALQRREEFIQNSLAQAKAERLKAEASSRELEARLHAARDEATAIVEEGRRDAEEVRRRKIAEAHQEADTMIERAKRDIGLARDTAVKELYETAAVLATNAASKIIRKELNAADHERLITDAIDEMSGSGSMN